MHVVVDFFVHADDAYKHFWPLTNWRFFSPVSYYDSNYYGQWFGILESVLYITLLLGLTKQYYRLSKPGIKIVFVIAWLWGIVSTIGTIAILIYSTDHPIFGLGYILSSFCVEGCGNYITTS
jgi:hypothetical protein